jgi:transposase-like protein
MKEDKARWLSFFQWLRSRGLTGVRLIVGDKCRGMLEAAMETLPEMRLKEAAKEIKDGIEETLAYTEFPYKQWLKIRK